MRSALYYPNTAVEDTEIVKTALLLWDHLEFIVPWKHFRPSYGNRQIARAMELIGKPHCPDDAEKKETHKRVKELVNRRLPPQFYFRQSRNRRGRDRSYDIYKHKLLPDTWSLLEEFGLSDKLLPYRMMGLPSTGLIDSLHHSIRQIHPNYQMTESGGLMLMSILADCCAGSTRARVTDRGDAYATIAGCLGNNPAVAKLKRTDAHERLVAIGLKVIDAPSLDVRALIEFREREEKSSSNSIRALRHRYVAALKSYVAKLTTEGVRESDADEIQRQFADDMKADLRDLRKELGFARNDAVLSKEVLVTAVAGVGTVASWLWGLPVTLSGVLSAVGGKVTVGALLATRKPLSCVATLG